MRASVRSLLVTLSAAICSFLVAGSARAQDPPAHLAFVDGSASIAREDDLLDATAGHALVPGDRLRTGTGRAELWFPDGSALSLDSHTSLELRSESTLLLTEGRAVLFVARQDDRDQPGGPFRAEYRIDTPAGSALSREPGEYRVALTSSQAEELVELVVVRGSADLLGDGGSVTVRSNERAFGRLGAAPSYPEVFMARPDAFDRWIATRRDTRLRRPEAVRYLPSNLHMYGSVFDRYGTWGHETAYGHVWYPSVDASWGPYSHGTWTALRPYGWTWAGLDAWGWPTHHYGRWGRARARWFWIPDRRWGPAWVSWADAPGYVGWSPLGYDNRPVFSLAVATGTWDGWVVVPRHHFGFRSHAVNRHALRRPHVPRSGLAPSEAPGPPSFRVHGGPRASRAGGVALYRDRRDVTVGAGRRWSTAPGGAFGDRARDGAEVGARSGAGRLADRSPARERNARRGPFAIDVQPGVRTAEAGAEPLQRRAIERRWGTGDGWPSTGADRRSDPSRVWSLPNRDRSTAPRRAPDPGSWQTPGPILPPQYRDRTSDHPVYAPQRGGPRASPRTDRPTIDAGLPGGRVWRQAPESAVAPPVQGSGEGGTPRGRAGRESGSATPRGNGRPGDGGSQGTEAGRAGPSRRGR